MSEELRKFTYCPICSGRLQKQKKRLDLCICKKCYFEFYLNPKPTNAAILTNENGELLFFKRRQQPQKGYWDLPGGFVESKETIEESVRREIKEEIGVWVKDISYFGSYPNLYPYQGILFHTISSIFIGKIKQQSFTSTDEAETIQFFSPEKIPFSKIAFQDVKHAMKDYLKR